MVLMITYVRPERCPSLPLTFLCLKNKSAKYLCGKKLGEFSVALSPGGKKKENSGFGDWVKISALFKHHSPQWEVVYTGLR